MEYQYPIDYEWSNEEMVQVISFFNHVEAFYEDKVKRETFKASYDQFKRIVPGKAEEKQIFKAFAKESGYEAYTVVKALREAPDATYLQQYK